MSSHRPLEVESPPRHASHDELSEALRDYNTHAWGEPHYTSIGYFLRDSSGELEAGLTARFRWGWLFVEMLWVAAHLRGQGVGSRLLAAAEAFALERGGVAIHLDAGDPPALRFYAKHGFEVVGRMEGFPPGGAQHFLRKWLQDPPHRG